VKVTDGHPAIVGSRAVGYYIPVAATMSDTAQYNKAPGHNVSIVN